ncbi:uncharacterized protein LY79DRAFT_151630 [Colletotrichum navitas]|uniref:Uncharacterized protein n=1 Tax=Colletotrichum navitas TaxID=681940 RepID=A0AAD8QCC9_9PEZI|nr:uncharacterized protein LY79DRAFT_151630 [Colletotrichum navitas]KAK1599784.1 hypothetical protein LY79DRAFT_151630 [Colletotrichum navitas]
MAVTGIADRQPSFPQVDGVVHAPCVSHHPMCCASPSASEAEDLVIFRKAWRGQILRLEGTCGQGGKGGSGPSNLAHWIGGTRTPPRGVTCISPGTVEARGLGEERTEVPARRARARERERERERGQDQWNRCLTKLKGHETRPRPHLHPSKRKPPHPRTIAGQ